MEIVNGITVCHECKGVFNGIAGKTMKCPECGSNMITLYSNMGVYDAVKNNDPLNEHHNCPNLIDGICELTGQNVWSEE